MPAASIPVAHSKAMCRRFSRHHHGHTETAPWQQYVWTWLCNWRWCTQVQLVLCPSHPHPTTGIRFTVPSWGNVPNINSPGSLLRVVPCTKSNWAWPIVCCLPCSLNKVHRHQSLSVLCSDAQQGVVQWIGFHAHRVCSSGRRFSVGQ